MRALQAGLCALAGMLLLAGSVQAGTGGESCHKINAKGVGQDLGGGSTTARIIGGGERPQSPAIPAEHLTTRGGAHPIQVYPPPVCRQAWRGADGCRAVVVSDELWSRIEPLLPKVERRFRYPGRKRLPDRQALQGILFVLYTGIAWRHLPPELGFGGGSTCHRRMDEWQRAGVWERLHELLLAELRAAGEIEWSRAVADSSHVQAKKWAPPTPRARLIEPETASSST